MPTLNYIDLTTMEIRNYRDYGDLNENGSIPCYIVSLKEQTYMHLTIPKEIAGSTDMSVVSQENKLLLINEKEAYLADLNNMKEIK